MWRWRNLGAPFLLFKLPVEFSIFTVENWKSMDSIIDPFPIAALQDRYGLSSLQSVYDRLNGIKIKPVIRGKISSDQLEILDRLDAHLKAGGTIGDFHHGKLERVEKTESTETIVQFDTINWLSGMVEKLALARSADSPLAAYRELSEAAQQGWILPTSIVAELIGIKPRGDRFVRGNFVFLRVGKVGKERGWIVQASQSGQFAPSQP
ncbi:hypothetical protein BZZ01_04585 [Nostocales cyanobacterium HT-58-2]|nr:hypothetical protein BZZ01_04585 [Nostocales cyanobacterium HT-58-2]